MPISKIDGFNIRLRLNNKTLIGVTQDDLSVTPTTKDSITKDNNGVKQSEVTGQEITFTVAGIIAVDSEGSTSMDSDALLEQSLKKGAAANIPFEYVRGNKAYSGNCVMTSYTESAPADPETDATFSAGFKVSGAMTPKQSVGA